MIGNSSPWYEHKAFSIDPRECKIEELERITTRGYNRHGYEFRVIDEKPTPIITVRR